MWHLSLISFLVHALFLSFGNRWICSQMVARLLSSKGIGSSFSVLRMPSMLPVLTLILCGAQFWIGHGTLIPVVEAD